MQNLMMDHGDIRTFLKYYLHRRVDKDTAAIVRGLPTQDSIMRSACNMSRWIDPNRPWGLTHEQASSVNEDPLIRSLVQQRDALGARFGRKATKRPEYEAISKRIISERQRLRNELLEHIQQRYEMEEPVRTVERQLAGVKLKEEPKLASYFSDDTLPEQRRLIEALMLAPPGATYEEEVARRNNAIDTVTAYCKVDEGETPKKRWQSSGKVKCVTVTKGERTKSTEEEALEKAMLAVYQEKRPTFCFWCVGLKRAPMRKRLHRFSTPSDLSKHFRRHLAKIKDGERPKCGVCELTLDHKMHLQRHAIETHGTVS